MKKLSEQIEQTCCGVLADKQRQVELARRLEEEIERLEGLVLKLKEKLMELDDER